MLQEAISEDDGSRHLENIRILTSKQYGEFLGFDGNFKDIFDHYQDLSFNLFYNIDKLYGAMRIRKDAERWLFGHNEDWIKTYLSQG
jgi:hypothetical protein